MPTKQIALRSRTVDLRDLAGGRLIQVCLLLEGERYLGHHVETDGFGRMVVTVVMETPGYSAGDWR